MPPAVYERAPAALNTIITNDSSLLLPSKYLSDISFL